METEVKRGRGRPRKILTEEELNRPKRPRGRPRKEISEEELNRPKRPRGRPRKEKVESNLPKRPRGRPRKYPTTQNLTDAQDNENLQIVENEKATVLENNTETQQAETVTKNKTQVANENQKTDSLEKFTQSTEDLQKGESYLKFKTKVAGIIESRVLEPLIPAKHLKETIIEPQPKPVIITPPLANKLNISRPKTPQTFAPKRNKKTCEKARLMPNKVIVITGATSGMGFAMAKNLSALGHIVIGVGRKPGLCRDALNEIRDAYPEANIHFLVADLSLMSQVKILADEIATKVASLGRGCVDVLIHNAGLDSQTRKITYENREAMWATNYLSVVLLTQCLQPMLDCSHDARVITFTTSRAAHKTKLNWKAISQKNDKLIKKVYNQTKLADLMFALEYDHRNADRDDLHAYCVDPGNVNTTLRTKNASGLRKFFFNIWRKHGKTVEQGIETAIYLAIAEQLPKNVVFYANKKPCDPSKFALDQNNRMALWRVTERELNS